MWQKEGLPSLICATCIERLRVAYDFRNICLQSDHTLHRYISHLQEDSKQNLGARPLTTPTKFDFAIPTTTQDDIPISVEEPQNAEYLHLKHFLDNDEDLAKNDSLVDVPRSSSASPDSPSTTGFLNSQNQHEQPQQQPSSQLQSMPHPQIHQQIQVTQPISQIQQTQIQIQPRQVIKRTTGIQVRPPTPSSVDQEGVDVKPFTCTICGKNYRKNANLRIHMRTHTGEKPFECKYCEKRFYHSSHLREHIRRHTGEKPFQCAVCNKRFTIKGELTMHMKSHTGEKPYACTCCDRRCLTAADLKVHMRTHTGEKPFSCVTCGKKIRQHVHTKFPHKNAYGGKALYL
jgi:KRAB domain-containing zinc finger protein